MSDYNFGYNGNDQGYGQDNTSPESADEGVNVDDILGEDTTEESVDDSQVEESAEDNTDADKSETSGKSKKSSGKSNNPKKYMRRDLTAVAETALTLSEKFDDEENIKALAALMGLRGNNSDIPNIAVELSTMSKPEKSELKDQIDFVKSISKPNEGGWGHVIKTIQTFSSLKTENKRGVFNLVSSALDDDSLTYASRLEDPDAVQKLITTIGDNGELVLEFIKPISKSGILD